MKHNDVKELVQEALGRTSDSCPIKQDAIQCLDQATLHAVYEGTLVQPDRNFVIKHLDECDLCRTDLAFYFEIMNTKTVKGKPLQQESLCSQRPKKIMGRPTFRIFVVRKAEALGLLIQKRLSPYDSRAAYFYSDEADGLRPTNKLRHICSDACHQLVLSNSDEDRIVEALIAYAEASEYTGGMYAARGYAEDLPKSRDLLNTVDRFFDQTTSALRNYLGSSQDFTFAILSQIWGKPKVIGRAERMGVLTPEQAHEVTEFQYLQHFKSILGINKTLEPKWFRRGGPIAVDFDHNKVYPRRQALEELRSFVMSTPASILEGAAATGKTVLVRNLAYDLYKEGRTSLFYFKGTDFVPAILAREINRIKGIVVIEDIHLNPEKYQGLYSQLDLDPDTHVLFTARPSLSTQIRSKGADFAKTPRFCLEAFGPMDEIIRLFAEDHLDPSLSWPPAIYQSIKEISGDSLLLLSWALESYVNNRGKGDPRTLLEAGVKACLHDLEILDVACPEVLVALSPLYQSEVLTAESFLVNNLGFDPSLLDMMVVYGEIICRQTSDGRFLYGLHHSNLAETYWKHGQEYARRRRIPRYEDFIYDYALSDVPNGLEAVFSAEDRLRERILARLNAEHKLSRVIANEQSTSVILSWLWTTTDSVLHKKDILFALANRIENFDDPLLWFECLSLACRRCENVGPDFWDFLDHKKLLERIARSEQMLSAVHEMYFTDEIFARKLYSILNIKDLATRLNEAEDTRDIGLCICAILRGNKDVGQKLWRILDKRKLADRLSRVEDFQMIRYCVRQIEYGNATVAYQLCNSLNLRDLAERAKTETYFWHIGECVSAILCANQEAGQRLWQLLDKKNLASRLSRSALSVAGWVGEHCINHIYSADVNKAHKLCGLLSIEDLAADWNQTTFLWHIPAAFSAVLRSNEQVGRKLWQLLDKQSLANKISRKEQVSIVGAFIDKIRFVNADMGQELCDLLDVDELARTLEREEDVAEIGRCICAIRGANEQSGRRLWQLLDKKNLAIRISRNLTFWAQKPCIEYIHSVDTGMAREMCDLLNLDDLASVLNNTNHVEIAKRCLKLISKVNEDVYKRLTDIL
jgi:hypothetical protein